MSAGGSKKRDEDERALFERAMREIEPLAALTEPDPPEDGNEHGALAGAVRPRARSSEPSGPLGKPRHKRLRIEADGVRMIGLAPGVDRRQLRRLRRGQVAIDLEVDLHGLTEAEAHRLVRRELSRAAARGWHCVRIIHGRGAGSVAGPVLKQALPRWLADPPPAVRVQAFTLAGPRLGGAGATLVLLG